MRFNKRGQFFILGAVIIAVMIFSLGSVSNKFVPVRENIGFYDYFDNVYREANAVLSYVINNGDNLGIRMNEFGSYLAVDILDRNLNADLILIYGNTAEVFVDNWGVNSVSVSGDSSSAVEGTVLVVIPGASSESLASGASWSDTGIAEDDIEVVYNGNIYNFALSGNNRVIVMLKEEFNDEVYIRVQ